MTMEIFAKMTKLTGLYNIDAEGFQKFEQNIRMNQTYTS